MQRFIPFTYIQSQMLYQELQNQELSRLYIQCRQDLQVACMRKFRPVFTEKIKNSGGFHIAASEIIKYPDSSGIHFVLLVRRNEFIMESSITISLRFPGNIISSVLPDCKMIKQQRCCWMFAVKIKTCFMVISRQRQKILEVQNSKDTIYTHPWRLKKMEKNMHIQKLYTWY